MDKFTVTDYRILNESKTLPTHYEIKLMFKGKNPLLNGHIVTNLPGDKWLVTKSTEKYAVIIDIENGTKVQAMLGLWEIKSSVFMETRTSS